MQIYGYPSPAVTPFIDRDANLIIETMATKPSNRRRLIINDTVRLLKDRQIWGKLDLLYMMAAHGTAEAKLNWMSPSTFALTVGAGSEGFTTDKGYTGDGTFYLTTGWDPATNATKLLQDSAHIGGVALTAGASTNFDIGSGTTTYMGVRIRTGGNGGYRVTSTTIGTTAAGGTVPLHIIAARRSDSANIIYNRNGVEGSGTAATSSALTTVDFNILRFNSAVNDRQIAVMHCGAELSAQQCSDMYAIINLYLKAVGAY